MPHLAALIKLTIRELLLGPKEGADGMTGKCPPLSPHCGRAKPVNWQGGATAGKVLPSRPGEGTEEHCSPLPKTLGEICSPHPALAPHFTEVPGNKDTAAGPSLCLSWPFPSLELRKPPLRSHISFLPGPGIVFIHQHDFPVGLASNYSSHY